MKPSPGLLRPDATSRRLFLSLFTLATFAVSQPLLDLFGRYPEFLVAHGIFGLNIVWVFLILSLAAPLSLALLVSIPANLLPDRARRIWLGFGVSTLFYLIVFPIFKRASSDLLAVGLSVVSAILLARAFAKKPTFQKILRIALHGAWIFPLLFAAFSPARRLIYSKGLYDTSFEKLHPKPNKGPSPSIVFLLLDELPTTFLLDSNGRVDARRFPNLAAFAATSTWARNASTVAHNTTNAIPAILSGSRPRGVAPTLQEYPQNLFTIFKQSYRLNAWESVTNLAPKAFNHRKAEDGGTLESLATFSFDAAAVFGHFVAPRSLERYLPDVSSNWGNFSSTTVANATKDNIFGGMPCFEERCHLFRGFVESLQANTEPTLNFLHVLLPHPAIQFNPDGSPYGTDEDFGLKGQLQLSAVAADFGFHRHQFQTAFVDKLVGQLVSRLKTLGIWDSSVVVITADHGVSYRAGLLRRDLSDGNAADILPVPLFIKTPEQDSSVILQDNVENIDILPSLIDLAGFESFPDLEGHSLFLTPFPIRKIKKTLAHKPRANSDDATYTVSFEDFLKNFSESHQRALARFGANAGFGEDYFRYGPSAKLIGLDVKKLPVQDSNLEVDMSDYRKLTEQEGVRPTLLLGTFTRPLDAQLAIAMNGKIVGVTHTTKTLQSPTAFLQMLPPDSVRPEGNLIEVFVIRDSGRSFLRTHDVSRN